MAAIEKFENIVYPHCFNLAKNNYCEKFVENMSLDLNATRLCEYSRHS